MGVLWWPPVWGFFIYKTMGNKVVKIKMVDVTRTAESATIRLDLMSDSGYYYKETHRISLEQWEKIMQILSEIRT